MDGNAFSELVIAAPRGAIYSRAAGSPHSELIIAIHGWSPRNGWSTWETLMIPLSQAGYYFVSLDMPGWGNSQPWSTESLSTQDAVDAVTAVITQLGRKQAVLMGKRWGGGVAIQTAIKYPDAVKKLILSAPAYRDLPSLHKILQPVLVAWAKDDLVIPFRYSKEYVERLPAVEFAAFEHGGHNAAANNAEEFAPIAVEFLLS